MSDQSVTTTAQDPVVGVILGERGGIRITAALKILADGSVQVRFDQTGRDQHRSRPYPSRVG
jgi:hypothetical protein